MRALERLPPADVTIWSDGSAREGTNHGGAGALIQLHHLGREEEVRATAGMICSSLRSELVAMREALNLVARLDPPDLERVQSICLLTDSRSGLQQLQRCLFAQTITLTAEI